MTKRAYKTSELYCCFALNRLIQELDIDLYQEGLEEKLDDLLPNQQGVTKGEIKYEIKTNNFMTNKVLKKLEDEKFIVMAKEPGGYRITITKEGVLHIIKFNEFYWQMFKGHIQEHYKFRNLPIWFEKLR